jgi:hypothetical protein
MLITARGAKSVMEEAKSARKEEFLKLFYEGGYADKFNEVVEKEAKKGNDRAMIEYPKGYYNETLQYLEKELGYVVVPELRAGVVWVAWF